MLQDTLFKQALVLLRILNSGVIMNIERNQRELLNLECTLRTKFAFPHVSLFNSFQGAVHAAIISKGYKYGDRITIGKNWQNSSIEHFLKYLGLNTVAKSGGFIDYIGPHRCLDLKKWDEEKIRPNEQTLIFNLTSFGFGPAAAFLTKNASDRQIAEQLKIFGENDLKTMWKKHSIQTSGPAAVQYNYRLSPIVAALLRSKIGGEL